MFKDLNMIAVSSASGFHMFDYESELKHAKSVQLKNVVHMCFVEMYIVVVTEDDENPDDVELLSYMLDSEEPEGQIKIKQFRGQKVKVQPSDDSICFTTGSQIGRIQVPQMELLF